MRLRDKLYGIKGRMCVQRRKHIHVNEGNEQGTSKVRSTLFTAYNVIIWRVVRSLQGWQTAESRAKD